MNGTEMLNLALLDWDNCLRRGFTLYDWAFYLARHDQFDRSDAGRLRQLLQLYSKGEIGYEELSHIGPETYARGMSGTAVFDVQNLAARFVAEDRAVFPFALPLVRTLIERDLETIVISGAPTELLQQYQQQFNWSRVYGIEISQENRRYSNSLLQNPATPSGKRELADTVSANRDVAVGLGDSISDLPLLDLASCRIVVDNPGLLPPDRTVLHVSTLWRGTVLIDMVQRFLDENE